MQHMEDEAKNVIESLKPIERLFPKKPPYLFCGEYLASKQFTRELPKKLPRKNFNFDNLAERSIATNYHFVLKEYFKIEDDLRETRAKAADQRQSMDQQWKELEEQELELRNTFIKFDEFVEQNKMKRERGAKKIGELLVRTAKKSEELERLQKEYDQIVALQSALDVANKNICIFEKFLSEVAKRDKVNFGTIDRIFSRYTALVKARQDLTDRYKNYMDELERIKKTTDQIIFEKFIQIEGMHNTITDLQRRLETSKIKASSAEKFVQQVFLAGQKKVQETEYAKQSCWQIYEHICQRKNRKPIYKEDPEKQLDVIKKCLRKLGLVNRMVEALKDENWSPPNESESSGDSIVANVVTRILSSRK